MTLRPRLLIVATVGRLVSSTSDEPQDQCERWLGPRPQLSDHRLSARFDEVAEDDSRGEDDDRADDVPGKRGVLEAKTART